ncbi:MAG: ethanolamine ammonia-lyase subunit EutC [Acidimicrobiales bacterium]
MSELLPDSLRGAVDTGDDSSAVTPARLLLGRAGTSYRTGTQLQLRADHAFAKDALGKELSLELPPMIELVERFGVFEVSTEAETHEVYLARPDCGRRLTAESIERLRRECPSDIDVQIVLGDGLSPLATLTQGPLLLGPLLQQCEERGWSIGRPFLVRHCRVGVINDIGTALNAQNVVLLVGERPGLATAESLSAYMAHCPRPGDTDAQRNLVSNIHSGGVSTQNAVQRIVSLIDSFMLQGRSGFMVREETRPTSLPGASGR